MNPLQRAINLLNDLKRCFQSLESGYAMPLHDQMIIWIDSEIDQKDKELIFHLGNTLLTDKFAPFSKDEKELLYAIRNFNEAKQRENNQQSYNREQLEVFNIIKDNNISLGELKDIAHLISYVKSNFKSQPS